jgi:DNA-binding transcriptional ArsR family regulator
LTRDEDLIEAELKGKTMLVYIHLLRVNRPSVGVREVQRALGFSSPSVAAYHLNKLRNLGLVDSERGDYRLVREVKIGVLRQFVTVGGFMLPRLLFYAVLVTTMLATYILQFPMTLSRYNVTALLMGAVPAVILWYETIKVWREKPA